MPKIVFGVIKKITI